MIREVQGEAHLRRQIRLTWKLEGTFMDNNYMIKHNIIYILYMIYIYLFFIYIFNIYIFIVYYAIYICISGMYHIFIIRLRLYSNCRVCQRKVRTKHRF